MKYKIISGTCVLPSITFYLFMQISIRLPRNTETPCFPVVKLKQTFWDTEVLLFFSCFLYSFLLTEQCLLSVPAQAAAARASLDSARALGSGSSRRCFLGQNSVTVRWHLCQVAQPSHSTLQCARNTSPMSCPCSQGMCTWVHLLSLIFWAFHQAAFPISPEHDFPEWLWG